MEIFNFSFEKEKDKLLQELKVLMQKKLLSPIIGSGLSFGIETKNGKIPNGNNLKDFVIKLLVGKGHIKEDLSTNKLPDLFDIFWEETKENKELIDEFQLYIDKNFLRSKKLENDKNNFVSCDWNTVYTLNIDNSIEKSLHEYEVIIPFEKQNRDWLKNKKCIYKIHGDAEKYLRTGDINFCIMGKSQYLKTIANPMNRDMFNHMQEAFLSNSIIFFGCSLDDELDLLFYNTETKERMKGKDNYYLSYNKKLTKTDITKLGTYGISKIIQINNQAELNDFCDNLFKISKSIEKTTLNKEIARFSNINFSYLAEKNTKNIDYLFTNDYLKINEDKSIILPSFFTKRNMTNQIIQQLNLFNLQVVFGNHFSGKTYCLYDIIQSLPTKQVYFFPSYIEVTDNAIKLLLNKENSVVVFDTNSINHEQIKFFILNSLEKLYKKNINIILAINNADRNFLKFYRRNLNEKIQIYKLDNHFAGEEISNFNFKIAKLSLSNYKNESILDYILKIEKNEVRPIETLFAEIDLSKYDIDLIETMIVLATKKIVTSLKSVELAIDESCNKLCEISNKAIQKNYYDLLELDNRNNAFKYFTNSPYWVYKSLSNYADKPAHHKIVAKAYLKIVQKIKNCYNRKNELLRKELMDFYFLDDMQDIFSKSTKIGSLKLPYTIYNELHSELVDDFQFLHQEAKSTLRYSKTCNENKTDILQFALRNINRAIDIVSESTPKNEEYTLGHMKFTKCLILGKLYNLTSDKKTLNLLLQCYHDYLYNYDLNILNKDISNKENKEFSETINNLIEKDIDDTQKRLIEEIYSKKISLN